MLIKSRDKHSSNNHSINDLNTPTYLNVNEYTTTQLLNDLFNLEINKNNFQDDRQISGANNHGLLLNLAEQLEESFEDAELTIEVLAKNLAVSERQLYRKFKDLLNTTPGKFLRTYRLEKAFWLIKQGESLGNIAYMVGFSSHSYFSRCFKEKYGIAPSEYSKTLAV